MTLTKSSALFTVGLESVRGYTGLVLVQLQVIMEPKW